MIPKILLSALVLFLSHTVVDTDQACIGLGLVDAVAEQQQDTGGGTGSRVTEELFQGYDLKEKDTNSQRWAEMLTCTQSSLTLSQ